MKPTKTAGSTGVEMNTPQKTHMDTQHEGLEKNTPFKEQYLYISNFWVVRTDPNTPHREYLPTFTKKFSHPFR